jgi:hypothetical protein
MADRPLSLIALVNCDSIQFRDINLTNSPCYTLWLLGCNNVHVDGITIRNPHDGPNTDGIDVDCCSNVRIANCWIDSGDDAIAVRSDASQLGVDKPCENINVTNCVLCSTPACALRVGYAGDSILRNCTFSNLTIYDTDIGIDMISILPNWPTIMKGTRCENIVFNNITMRDVKRAIFIWMGNERGGDSQIYMKNVAITNVIAQSRFGSYIGGYDHRNVEDITLANVRLTLTGQMPPEAALADADVWGGVIHPCALYCNRAEGLRLIDVSLDFRQASGPWQYGVFCTKTSNTSIRGLQTQGLAARSPQSVLGFNHARATVRDVDAEPQVATFCNLTNDSHVTMIDCDLSSTKTPWSLDKESTVSDRGNALP